MPENLPTGTTMAEVISRDKQFNQAALQADIAALESMMSDDYLFISNVGRILNKEEHIATLKSGELKYNSLDADEVKVRVYGDTAILNARVTGVGSFNGQDINGRFLVARVYVKQGGDWAIVSAQATPSTQ